MLSKNVNTNVQQSNSRRFLRLLAGCLALQLTGTSLVFPVFAKKIGLFGSGVEIFGLSSTAFSLTALVAVPYMGGLADRFGRRLVLLSGLIAHALASLGYLLAPTGEVFIGVRALAGAFTAGLIPASITMVADVAPQGERGRWIGFVNGWSAIGFVIGPPLGGWLFEQWGLGVPFIVAVFLNILAFLIGLTLIPETSTLSYRGLKRGKNAVSDPNDFKNSNPAPSIWAALPRPYSVFVMLILISFIAVFAWRFIEPQFHFYIYDELGWTSSRFGLTMSGYAILLMLAETFLGRLSDRYGRGSILMAGLLVHCAQYVALIMTDAFIPIALGIALSGLGEGLFMPALNAYYLDITPEAYRGRVIGIKESAFTLGGLVGPALVVLAVQYFLPRGIFIISGLLVLFSAVLIPLMVRKNQGNEIQYAKTINRGLSE